MTLNDESQAEPQSRKTVRRERRLMIAGVVAAGALVAALVAAALGVDVAALTGG